MKTKSAREYLESKIGKVNLAHPVTGIDYEDLINLMHNFHHQAKDEFKPNFPSDEEMIMEAKKQGEEGSTIKEVQYVYSKYFEYGVNWLKSKLQ